MGGGGGWNSKKNNDKTEGKKTSVYVGTLIHGHFYNLDGLFLCHLLLLWNF